MFLSDTDYSNPTKFLLKKAQEIKNQHYNVVNKKSKYPVRTEFDKKITYNIAFILQNFPEFLNGKRLYLFIPHNRKYWQKNYSNGLYKKIPENYLIKKYITFDSIHKAIKILQELNYISIQKGNGLITADQKRRKTLYEIEVTPGYMSKIQFTQYGFQEIKNLLKIENTQNNPSVIIKHKLDKYSPIRFEVKNKQKQTVFKKSKKQAIIYEEVPKEFEEEINTINNFYKNNQNHIPEEFGNIFLQRIFSESTIFGGRLYAPYQSIPKKEREQILNKYNWSEYDFKALHPNLLLKLNNLELPPEYNNDFYTWFACQLNLSKQDVDIHRDFFKKLFLILTNNLGKKQVLRSLYQLIKQYRYSYNKIKYIYDQNNEIKLTPKLLINFIEDIIPKSLSQYFYTGIGLIIQRIDSEIIIKSLHKLQKQNITCLPIHDSIIGPINHIKKIQEIMEETFIQEIYRINNNQNHIFHIYSHYLNHFKVTTITYPKLVIKDFISKVYFTSSSLLTINSLIYGSNIQHISINGLCSYYDNILMVSTLNNNKFTINKVFLSLNIIKQRITFFYKSSIIQRSNFYLYNNNFLISIRKWENRISNKIARFIYILNRIKNSYVRVWV